MVRPIDIVSPRLKIGKTQPCVTEGMFMGRITKVAAIAAAMLLSGCGPSYSPQELAAVSNAKQVNEALARDHKITWTEAARRNIAEATRVAGPRLNDHDQLIFSYRLALAAEVDAGRMTPELADYRMNERVAADQAAAQQRQAEAIQAFGSALQAAGQTARQNQPVTCMSNRMGTMVTTTCN